MGNSTSAKPVEASHQRTEKGVRFNVEAVSKGSGIPNHLLGQANADLIAKEFYAGQRQLSPPKVEATSLSREHPDTSSIFCAGLADLVLVAFNHHLPLVLRPDDIWMVLSYSFSKHVEDHAEELRKNFVQHEGKKQLVVHADHFVLGQMKPQDWERDIFPDFSKQIKENIGEKVHSTIAGGFSTTTVVDQAAHEITLMASMKKYFSYACTTMCGIPSIELQGTEDDWKTLRERAKQMCLLMTPEAGKKWFSNLEPVLDEFVDTYQGKVNHHFWQGMVKWLQHGQGSGSYQSVSGWISLFYHELQSYHKPWDQMTSAEGPQAEEFPMVRVSAPVTWFYHGSELPLHFHAGIFAGNWDPKTNAVSCQIGWVVSHDPPKGND